MEPKEDSAVGELPPPDRATGFRGPPAAWAALAACLPNVIDEGEASSVRGWSAGGELSDGAGGEDAYMLGILLAELLGAEAFARRVKIYVTDADDVSLSSARHATYADGRLDVLPGALVDKYFVRSGDTYVVCDELRHAVVFGRHDLVRHAPICHIDVIVCPRLVSFGERDRARISRGFEFALRPKGVLFLGTETLVRRDDLVSAVDARGRRPVPSGGASAADVPPSQRATKRTPKFVVSDASSLHEAIVATSPFAHFVVGADGSLAQANTLALAMLGLSPSDVGRPFVSSRLGPWGADLQFCIDESLKGGEATQGIAIERVSPRGDRSFVDIHASPLRRDGAPLGTLVAVTDVTDRRRMRGELRRVTVELETTSGLLAMTQAELAAANRELQTMSQHLRRTTDARPREPSRGLAKATLRPPPSGVERGVAVGALDESEAGGEGHVKEVR